MAAYATYDDFRRLASPLDEQRRMLKAAASVEGKTVFLSHSSKDNELVPTAVAILEGHCGRVYVDLGDSRLPETPSTETARILRETVRDTRRFVLLVSPRSKESIWIPWELGLADGMQGVSSVAIFPVVEDPLKTSWSEREYLGLYRRIVWGKLEGYENNLWMVLDFQLNTAIRLVDWLL